jgi:hypothetical protein
MAHLSQFIIRLFGPQNCPSLRSGQFRGQKCLGPLEKPSKSPIMCFARIKKITSRTIRNSSTLIVKSYSYIYSYKSQFQKTPILRFDITCMMNIRGIKKQICNKYHEGCETMHPGMYRPVGFSQGIRPVDDASSVERCVPWIIRARPMFSIPGTLTEAEFMNVQVRWVLRLEVSVWIS